MLDATRVSEKRGLLATGGLIGGILASSCCIAPLAFVTLGISGAWIGNLTALAIPMAIRNGGVWFSGRRVLGRVLQTQTRV